MSLKLLYQDAATADMADRHPQDDLLVVDALVNYAHLYEDSTCTRTDHAHALADALAASYGLETSEAIL